MSINRLYSLVWSSRQADRLSSDCRKRTDDRPADLRARRHEADAAGVSLHALPALHAQGVPVVV